MHAGLEDVLETRETARLAVKVARLREPAHLQHGVTPRFVPRHALPHVLLGQQRDMRGQLLVEVLVEPVPAEDRHDADSASRRLRVIARVLRRLPARGRSRTRGAPTWPPRPLAPSRPRE